MADQLTYPRGGYFNGMGITLTAVAVAAAVGGAPGWGRAFVVTPDPALVDAFQVSIGLMVLHKIESGYAGEYDVAPVYLRAGAARVKNTREALFRMFVATFLVMLVLVDLLYRGGPWPMLLLGAWAAQGLQELHHVAKSIAHRALYAGTLSGVLFSTYTLGRFLPLWTESLGWSPIVHRAVWLALPLVILVLWAEHRSWIRASEALGLPIPYRESQPTP